ncbi:uncharacterized protein LOC120269909 isoform X1 [Dioscorea cayenensis subsp. rotundata]|uniref:Uncharacterized protein LOC120269909 isoform X1 n=1 Tax=Dioscorea cayennensis subsp. rotundata TaxID=55577 RepID=A0AB40BZI2_DIOCR|nr:uncharacterized protein LOC120269909 isoform X1 [Dioscorea cayenensis subsp. rotundata]
MGCIISTPLYEGGKRRWPKKIGEVAIFVPSIRIPKEVDLLQHSMNYHLLRAQVEHLARMRAKIAQVAPYSKQRRRIPTQHGGSVLSNLLQALEDYLRVLLGLLKEGSELIDKVEFVWVNQEDDLQETTMPNVWYEVLSVLHLMAMLCLSETNFLLLAKPSASGLHSLIIQEYRRTAIDILVKAAGYLDCAIQHVLPKISSQMRRDLPIDLSEEVLGALCAQALAQGVDLQLWVAIDSPKATLAVKRRLACEMVIYWQQAYDNIMKFSFNDGWGAKHQLFARWKLFESKAAAYYYHGMILEEGNTEKSHEMAIAATQAAHQFFINSKMENEAFNKMHPFSRNPPLWGSMKYLSEKLSKEISTKFHINQDISDHERFIKNAPILPDFVLALKPDEYHLP